MSSEVCPFCGKTYKRLKSHLPHCKAAAAKSKTPPTEHHVKAEQTTSSSQLLTGFSEPTAKGKKSTQTPTVATSPQSKRTAKVSAASSSPATPSSSQSFPLSSPSLPPSTNKKKQKLSKQIKMATTLSSPISSPAPSLSPTASKPKKKSLRALIEAAKSDQVTKGSLEGARSAWGDLPSGSTPFLTDSLKSFTSTAKTETNIIPHNTSLAPLSTDTKPKHAPKKKSLSTTKDIYSWVDNSEKTEDKMFLKSGSGHQARITIQDVKATLGRDKTTSQSRMTRILGQVENTDNLSSKTRLDTGLRPVKVPAESQKDVVSCLETTSSNSKQSSLIPLQRDGSFQPEPTSPETPIISGHLSSQASQATPLLRTVSMNEGLKGGHHMTDLLSASPSPIQLSTPHLSPLGLQAVPLRTETLKTDVGFKLEDRKQNTAHSRTKGAVTQRSLGQVRLRELPEWLACKTPSHPRDVAEMVQRELLSPAQRSEDLRVILDIATLSPINFGCAAERENRGDVRTAWEKKK
ncbi:cell wall protein RBR3 isoform X2 [Toxotes jaculatrix]|uniref:cell wall protein RBR3 isoform X2 n=1 Tax=Toxotes jaculatrix TaxID=941984 RepID=UPI001B3B0322|nr:cell wall protein RBR3 isoform X2 [Toxotes jaculatrix]